MVATDSLRPVNNAIYDDLGDRWYDADDDPVALLRAESRLRNPWIAATIAAKIGPQAKVLDVGCGAGFLSNDLARRGFEVTGIDASVETLAVAGDHDSTERVIYQHADALALPFSNASFDVVCAMDFLEHVEDPAQVIREAARVLRPGGLFFFHTFNRNFMAWLIVIKGVERFVRNTPRDLHVLRLFIKPSELRKHCENSGFVMREVRGSAPVMGSRAFWSMLKSGIVPRDFRFMFTRSELIAYTGFAERVA